MIQEKKILFGFITIELYYGNGAYKTVGNTSWVVADYTLVYKIIGVIFHSVTIVGLTRDEALAIFKIHDILKSKPN